MHLPYDGAKLDRLMEEAGADLVLAFTRHNIRYLCGGYYYHFHERFQAIAEAQYTPLLAVPRGRPGEAFLVGGSGEFGQARAEGLWVPEIIPTERHPAAAAREAARAIRKRGLERAVIALERDFLPVSAMDVLARELPGARFVEALDLLEELRAIKRPEELDIVRHITQADAEAIQTAFRTASPGATTRRIASRIEQEMTERGVHFLWAFTSAGPAMLRAPSEKVWEKGEVLHLDAGGEQAGYLTDVCRMGCRGEPSPLARELFAACLATQDKVRAAVRPGAAAGAIYDLGCRTLRETGHGAHGQFLIHGMGLVSHEQPRFGPGAGRKLEAGMVISIETDIRHPEVGYVKLEDTVAVTPSGCEGLGDLGRDQWAAAAA
jgi:Xaa-Pro aminopeptidase